MLSNINCKWTKRKIMIIEKAILNVDEVVLYTGLKRSYLYKLMHLRKVPYSKPGGRKAFFSKKELDAWLMSGRVTTERELECEAATSVLK